MSNVELANMRLMKLVIVFSLAAVTAACATDRTNLTETGAVKVRIDDGPGSPVQYVTVHLDPDEDETVIRGKVYGTGVPYYPRYGKHVHVKVISPDGQVIANEDPRLIWRTGSKFRSATGSFTVRLPDPVPDDTIVDVVFHDTLHNSTLPDRSAS
jgi:hypothetical protein